MTSNDNNIYIREDVFNARMDALISQIRLDNEKLRNELNSKIDSSVGMLQTQISVLSTRIDGLDSRMNDLQNSISWNFTLIAVFIAILGVLTGIIAAFAPSIWNFFKHHEQNTISNEDIRTIVASEVNLAVRNLSQQNFPSH